MTDRTIVVRGAGVALAEARDGDRTQLDAAADGLYAVERDDEPRLVQFTPRRLVVVDPDSGELLGDVSWHPVVYGPNRGSSAWNVGMDLLPSARARGIGSTALRLLVEHLFAATDLDRVEASTDVTNAAAQRVLERCGFRREGVIRGAQYRAGERHDLVQFSILRTDEARLCDSPGSPAG